MDTLDQKTGGEQPSEEGIEVLLKCTQMMMAKDEEINDLGISLFEQYFPERLVPFGFRTKTKCAIYLTRISNMLSYVKGRNTQGDGGDRPTRHDDTVEGS